MAYTYSRRELYDFVWSEPKTVLAQRFAVSDVWLSKICRAANIPIPPRGYWAKIAAGKKPPKLVFPERDLGEIDEVTIGKEHWSSQLEPIVELPPSPCFAETLEEVLVKARKRLGRLKNSKTLSSPHHLIQELLDEDERRRVADKGESYVWDKPRFDDATNRRRLRILNSLFLMLSMGGFRPTLKGKDAEEPGVKVGDYHVSFKLEKLHQRARSNQGKAGRQKEPLQFEISNWTQAPEFPRQRWQDSDTESLEGHLPEIAISLVAAGEMLYRGAIIRHYNWLVSRKTEHEKKLRLAAEQAAREIEAARLADIKRRRDILLSACANREKAVAIRALVDDAAQQPNVAAASQFEAWRKWALAEADQLDPFINSLSMLLAAAPEPI